MGCLGKQSGATNEQLKCWYTNTNSLVGKMDEVRQRITGGKYDIVGITETWAHQGITDAELHIDGYLMFRKDRHGRGGGVLLYVNEELNAGLNGELTSNAFQESIWCNIGLGNPQC